MVKRLQDAIAQDDQPEPQPTTTSNPAEETSPSTEETSPSDPSSLLKPTSPDPLADPENSAKGASRDQTPPPSGQAAEKNDSVVIDDKDMQEQVLGDMDGDLGVVMEDAEREGKEERKQDDDDKEDEGKDEEGVVQTPRDGTPTENETGTTAGEKRKRADDSFGMDVDDDPDDRTKKARTGEGEMDQDERTEDGESRETSFVRDFEYTVY